jgi:hypothetical protein
MKFMLGEKVSYTGSKHSQELHGKLGEIIGRVSNDPEGVVVDFGSDSYVMNENRHLTRAHSSGKFSREDKRDKSDRVEIKNRRSNQEEE